MTDIRGPVTVVTGKNRRLTIIECPNDLGSMIDMGKIADLVLLMIDGSFGLEMVSIFRPPGSLPDLHTKFATFCRKHSKHYQ